MIYKINIFTTEIYKKNQYIKSEAFCDTIILPGYTHLISKILVLALLTKKKKKTARGESKWIDSCDAFPEKFLNVVI